ncbi:MAG: phosphoenolpyruvate synthase [Candidatus Diapherotrites archaeon]
MKKEFILWFNEIGIKDIPSVGGKNASLGEMYSNLNSKGVNVPNGFAITAYAYDYLLDKSGLKKEIKSILKGLDTHDMDNLSSRGNQIRTLIRNAYFPEELRQAIISSYKKLSREYSSEHTDVAVRSSATAEDLPDASFAGQQETYLNIVGERALIDACRKCFASLFTDRAISYREDKKFNHFDVSLSIAVQKMVRADHASSGVIFSIDSETGFENAVLITGAYGLGETVVQGKVNTDEFYVFKPTLKKGFKPILKKSLGSKKIKMIYDSTGNKETKIVLVDKKERKKFILSDNEILKLAEWTCIIEDHYSKKKKKLTPMDIEWAKDGVTGKLFIVQARPETVHSQKNKAVLEKFRLKEQGKILVKGKSVGERIGQGKANIIMDVKDIRDFKEGEILVTEMTDPDWEPIMKKSAGIVTEKGSRTCFDGNTKILTNQGFMTLEEIHEKGTEGLLTLSFNIKTKKTEWKPVLASMKRKKERIKISVSQTGKIKDNTLILTPNHKMINIRNSEIVTTEIQEILKEKEMLCVAQKIPSINQSSEKDNKLAYLLGGIMTDGSIYQSKSSNEVQFIQKNIPEKEEFINYMNSCMTTVYNKSFVPFEKKVSSGFIRGKKVEEQAMAYRLYSKQIAHEMFEEKQQITKTLLNGDLELAYNFLGGVIDGDGCFYNNRIHIYVSSEHLLEAIMVACLRIGTLPNISKNRTINHVSIVEKKEEILKYTKRVKGKTRERIIGTRFFSAKQIFNENIKGKINDWKNKNLLIGEKQLNKIQDPKIKSIIESDIRMLRVTDNQEKNEGNVFNITVEDNHNYLVFTKKLTPLIVCNCHAAIISRELNIPCIVGAENATKKIPDNKEITIDCSSGEDGIIYEGLLKFEVEKHELGKFPETRTKIMLNLASPEQAFEKSFLPSKGIGLARMEFIINNHIQVHPNALIQFNKLKDAKLKKKINELTFGYKDKKEFFVDKLAQGISMLAAAFYPHEVILRFSDFKTNEYANLLGGKDFEPVESNPMIGWRGASRYYDEKFKEAFALECKAVKKIREEMGLTNLTVMVPFCRTVEEGKKVIAVLKENRLVQGKNGLKVIAMCEIPSNAILAEEFLDVFDGFSIGSNDLTQLVLGLDRDSELVSSIYDEEDLAVKKMVKQAIQAAKKKKKYIGFCGQAPSDKPSFAKFLIECGIDSISLNPDTVIKTTMDIAKYEKKFKRKN